MPDKLLTLIASLMEVDVRDIGEDSNRDSIEKWDSMREMLLASMLESEFGITLGLDDVENLHSVAQIRAILAAHGVAA